MGKFYYAVGDQLTVSYIDFLVRVQCLQVAPKQLREAIVKKPTLLAFDNYDEAKLYAAYKAINYKIEKKWHYTEKQAAVYKIYVLDVPEGLQMKEGTVTSNEGVYLTKHTRQFQYYTLNNMDANIIIYSAFLTNNPQIDFVPFNSYEKYFAGNQDVVQAVVHLFKDYSAPGYGIIPKVLMNYHFTGEAQQLVSKIEGKTPEVVYHLLRIQRESLLQKANVNRTGSFITSLEYALQKLNQHLFPNQQQENPIYQAQIS